jgi:Aerotolerance regulator N-terminal/von Willebrand factor type A domain
MSFLAPWFLFGALAVAGPILFHLIRRAARERTSFSSLMFLRPTPPRITRRRKLEHLWLLLLRCLCLLLLAAGFSRPFFSKDNGAPAPAAEGRQLVLLVDTSASMRREGVWEKARAVAGQYLAKSTPADQVAIVTFDRQPRTLVSFADWSSWAVDQRAALARDRLAAVSPGWMGTLLGLALTSAGEQFIDDSAKEKPASRRELVVITDLQEGAKLDGLQGHEWPSGVKAIIERIDAKRHTNAGLGTANPSATHLTDDTETSVRVTNARDSQQEKFRLGWSAGNGGGLMGEATEVYLPPGQTRSFPVPKIPAGMTVGELHLTGDEEPFDNVSYFAAPEQERVTIAYFGLESASDPATMRYYLQRAFPDMPRRQIQLITPTTNTVFSPELLNQAAFAVIPGRLTPEEAAAVRDWLTRGKTALMVLTDAQMGPTLGAVAGAPEIQVTEASGDYSLLGEIDFAHPLFAPFADPRFSDFSHIHFWKHRRMELPAGPQNHVLAAFDDHSPALAQLAVGKGTLLVLASGWQPGDSQFALSSKFLPLMQTMLDWSSASASGRFQFQTGDSIPSPSPAGGAAVEWQKPDGKKETVGAGAPFAETDMPGIYTAAFGGRQRRFAVNLPLDESRTAPLSPDELARLGVPLQATAGLSTAPVLERERHLRQAELENRQKLWRWLIVGVLAVTFGEILLSGAFARRAKTPEVAA